MQNVGPAILGLFYACKSVSDKALISVGLE